MNQGCDECRIDTARFRLSPNHILEGNGVKQPEEPTVTRCRRRERTLSERQRAHVAERLRDYARDFKSLAAAR